MRGFFWEDFFVNWRIFWEGSFREEFLGGFFGRIFLGGSFGRNSSLLLKSAYLLESKRFVKILSQRRRKEEGRTRNLDP